MFIYYGSRIESGSDRPHTMFSPGTPMIGDYTKRQRAPCGVQGRNLMKPLSLLVLITAVLSIVSVAVAGQGRSASGVFREDPPMRVGTLHSPPFIVKSADGSWSGISIALWRRIAEELDLTFEFEERDIQGLLDGVQDGSLDVAVAALTITEGRETELDFTHPFQRNAADTTWCLLQKRPRAVRCDSQRVFGLGHVVQK